MATNFPGSADNWANPVSTTKMDDTGYEHDTAHTNVNDAIEAVQAQWFATLGLEWPSGALGDFACQMGPSATGQSVNIGHLSATPMNLPHPVTVTEVRVQCTSGNSGSSLRLGFYSKGGSNGPTQWGTLAPGDLIATAGTVTGNIAGAKIITGLNISLPAGISWFSWLGEGTAGGTWICSNHLINAPIVSDWNIKHLGNLSNTGGSSFNRGVVKTGFTTGSLPDPWPTSTVVGRMTAFGWFATDST